jgi:magnesium transporter
VTVRYCDPRAFHNTNFIISAGKKSTYSAIEIFCILIDSSIERLADLLENVEKKIDVMGKTLFKPSSVAFNFKSMLQSIGQQGDRVSKAHESLVTLGRMLSFTLETLAQDPLLDSNIHSQMHILIKDISSLSHHTNFLSSKINFLLDATLGLINIEQNKIIKILSVAAVIFSPPTLIASIYGMNFEIIPELKWSLGYPFALTLMFMCSAGAYQYFCYKKWL